MTQPQWTTRTQWWSLALLFCFCWLTPTRHCSATDDETYKQTQFRQLIQRGDGLRARHAATPPPTPTTPPHDATFKQQRRPKKHRRRHRPGRHVCTHEETVTRPIKVVESYCKPVYKSFTQRCANGTNTCTAFRVQYETLYRTVVKYHTTKDQQHQCCPGWTHPSKNTHSCTKAICSEECQNGSCVKPDVCKCKRGYTGSLCQTDVDECSTANRCQQRCVNTVGSFTCACHDGFQLQDDGHSCRFRLELVPELQTLLHRNEAMAERVALLEQELVKRDWPVEAQQTSGDLNSALVNMTQHIALLEEKISTLQDETNAFMTNSIGNAIESPADSLTSLSEQIAILEERLADCTCTPSSGNTFYGRR